VQITLYDLPSRPGKRGVGHRHERWGGERWTRQCPRAGVIAGRILSIREWSGCAQTNGTFAYVQKRVVLTPQRLASSLAEVLQTQPGEQDHIRKATVSNKPDHRGERAIAVKTIAQGKSDCLRCPVCSCAFFLHKFAHETAGAARIRLSLRPLFFGRVRHIRSNLGRGASRECEGASIDSSLRAQRSNLPIRLRRHGLLR
jgi:hypothetical protein